MEVDRESGRVRPLRFVAAVDSGQVVNPNGIANQIEGAILQSISWTLHEQVTFDRNRITSLNWASYPILRFSSVPDTVDVHIVNRPGQPFLGTGEAGQGPTAAALANAISPRRDMVLVAAAGPVMNIALAVVAALAFHIVGYLPGTSAEWLANNLKNAVILNVVLAVFNLFPLPPLMAGSSKAGCMAVARLEPFGLVILVGLLIILPGPRQRLPPIRKPRADVGWQREEG